VLCFIKRCKNLESPLQLRICPICITGYKLYYSINGEAEEQVNLSPEIEHHVIGSPAAALCVIRVAAATRRGAGPVKSMSLTGELYRSDARILIKC
jgi:hypothetical protein